MTIMVILKPNCVSDFIAFDLASLASFSDGRIPFTPTRKRPQGSAQQQPSPHSQMDVISWQARLSTSVSPPQDKTSTPQGDSDDAPCSAILREALPT